MRHALGAVARAATALAACALAACAPALAAGAGGGAQTLLERYLEDLHTLRTDFAQTVTDAQGHVVDSGAGSLLVERPGRFRWDYQPRSDGSGGGGAAGSDSGQLLIADGRNLWFYDRELAQVTVRPLSAGLAATPILLLSGSLADLRAAFDVSDAGQHDGLRWVAVQPHDPQAGFRDAQLGFRADQLARMIVHDRLGQTVQLDFSHSERNAPLDATAFQFEAPPGVDVIGTPQS